MLVQISLRQVFLEAVEESLASLGDSPAQAVFFHLEKVFDISKVSIPSNMAGFSEALESIFGIGASLLEKSIARRFCAKTGREFKDAEEWSLARFIDSADERAVEARCRRG